MIPAFQFSSLPEISFGAGSRHKLLKLAGQWGKSILLVSGSAVLRESDFAKVLISDMKKAGYRLIHEVISREPSPKDVDEIVERSRPEEVDLVIAVGGGSVMDAGKAVSAMLPVEGSVKDYLEGVGHLQHPGTKVPFIAIPTTAGTGSEMTKNAVISEVGESGFKKSLRHDHFIPDHAIIDPELSLSCPPELTATSGMDAFSQLLESYLSSASNPMTDALALQGLKQIKKYLLRAYLEGQDNLEARAGMSLAAMFSGITLAHAGLGLVHGFASPLGGFFHIPHGVVCGTLMAPVFATTIDNLLDQPEHPAMQKLLIASKVFADFKYKKEEEYLQSFKDKLIHFTTLLDIPGLDAFGFTEGDIDRVLRHTSHKNHPVELTRAQLEEVLRSRIQAGVSS
ncbi:MAG: alcohol dehydrogenase [Bacteroidetes bacterium]|nr:MAG: alcohol dehydrogenase [Bacteroidota bacterium]